MRSASGTTPGTRCWRRSTPCWAGRRSMPVEVVAFCCFYCAYAAADLAGVMRLSYPPNVKVVLLPCTGGGGPPPHLAGLLVRGGDGRAAHRPGAVAGQTAESEDGGGGPVTAVPLVALSLAEEVRRESGQDL